MGAQSLASTTDKRRPVYNDVQHAQVTSILADGDVPYADHEMDADERVIMALGYKQEFKREFSLWTTFCVSFAVLGLLPSFASTLYYGMCCGPRVFVSSSGSETNLTATEQEWDMQVQLVWFGVGLLL